MVVSTAKISVAWASDYAEFAFGESGAFPILRLCIKPVTTQYLLADAALCRLRSVRTGKYYSWTSLTLTVWMAA